jgi:hypothetical protein
MAEPLDYEGPNRDPRLQRPRRLLVPMLIALVAAPAMAVLAAVLGLRLGWGSWPLSPDDLWFCIGWGIAWGVAGGLLTAALAAGDAAVRISVVGSLIVSVASGGSLCVYASMMAAV